MPTLKEVSERRTDNFWVSPDALRIRDGWNCRNMGNAGMGVQAIGKVPHAGDAGMGEGALLTSGGRTAWRWLHKLADRLERVRIVHGDWSRCLNNHFGGDDTAIFLDPPYRGYEREAA